MPSETTEENPIGQTDTTVNSTESYGVYINIRYNVNCPVHTWLREYITV